MLRRLFMFIYSSIYFGGIAVGVVYAGYWTYVCVDRFGVKVIPVVLLSRYYWKFLHTLVYLDSRYLTDRTNTQDRIFNPERYNTYRLKKRDFVALFLFRRMPDMKERSHYSTVPLPFSLYHFDRINVYWKKCWRFTLIYTLFCLNWIFDWYPMNLDILFKFWLSVSFIGLLLRDLGFMKYYETKRGTLTVRLLSMTWLDIYHFASFGLVPLSVNVSKFRIRIGYLFLLACCVIYFIRMEVKL